MIRTLSNYTLRVLTENGHYQVAYTYQPKNIGLVSTDVGKMYRGGGNNTLGQIRLNFSWL
jgi:hypothetical protein